MHKYMAIFSKNLKRLAKVNDFSASLYENYSYIIYNLQKVCLLLRVKFRFPSMLLTISNVWTSM